VKSLTITEPESPMLRRLECKACEQAPGAAAWWPASVQSELERQGQRTI